ncbi:MAG: N-formylglutamate amidohydrolase [Pseudomonadota bacterium]|jgi:N-formylglutamate deformylase
MSFSVLNPEPTIPIVANVPHSSCVIPPHTRGQFIVSDGQLREEHRQLVDWFVDDLFKPIVDAGGCMIKHEVSRFVVDPERFEDDQNEIMAARGMGVIYTHGCHQQRIRRALTTTEREDLLQRYYRPYHADLTDRVRRCIDLFGSCIFIDCHSYQSAPLPYELDGNAARPDIIVGTDSFHTSSAVVMAVERIALSCGYSFGVDRPFAGTVVPNGVYRDPRITAFMLEIKRSTYMNELASKRSKGFEEMRACIRAITRAVLECSLRLSEGRYQGK